MIIHPDFDPVAISIGPLSIHWYGLMYLAGFLAGGLLGYYRATHATGAYADWHPDEMLDVVFYLAIGVIVGGRLGYVLFYNPFFYFSHLPDIFAVWDGGMSFHGGLLGVITAVWLYARKTRRGFLRVGDFLTPLCLPGLAFGRLGNFINQELWGRATDVPWAMLFPAAPDAPDVLRHPSQLYEFALEGVLLFIIVWIYSSRPRACGRVSGLFFLGYGIARFIVEFFREPDAHLGPVVLDWMTMGQLLSVPMILLGIYLLLRRVVV